MTRVTSQGTILRTYCTKASYGGVPVVLANYTTSITTSTLTRSDIVRNTVSKDGWRKPSPYDASLVANGRGSINAVVDYPEDQRFYTVVAPTTAPAITLSVLNGLMPPSSDVDIAVIKARNNVADRVASFGESLAELRNSIAGLGDLATKISNFIEAALAKDYKNVARHLGVPYKSRKHRRAVMRYNGLGVPTVGNAFLCWNFGLSPIISDMVSLAILMGEGKNLRVTGKGLYPRNRGDMSVLTLQEALPYAPGASLNINYSNKVSSGTYVRLDYDVSFETLRNLTTYGLMDAPATIWALLPYSFLVDFVLPVSEVLRSLTATYGLTFKGGTATRFVSVERKYQHCQPAKSPVNLKWDQLQHSGPNLRGKRMIRTVFKTEPNPVTLWVKDPLSAFSVATVLALLAQKLKLR